METASGENPAQPHAHARARERTMPGRNGGELLRGGPARRPDQVRKATEEQALAWLDAARRELPKLRDLADRAPTWQERMAARRLILDGAVRLSVAREKRASRQSRQTKRERLATPSVPTPARGLPARDLPPGYV